MLLCSLLGLGPGGLTITGNSLDLNKKCIPGASHGGYGGKRDGENGLFDLPEPYDRNNTASLLGGSGGEVIMTFIWSRKNYLNNDNTVM